MQVKWIVSGDFARVSRFWGTFRNVPVLGFAVPRFGAAATLAVLVAPPALMVASNAEAAL
jgi:hypothetical protein